MWYYEVILTDRKTGEYIECIYSGTNVNEADNITVEWNEENVDDFDYWEDIEKDYVDGTDGMFANIHVLNNENQLHGVGKY